MLLSLRCAHRGPGDHAAPPGGLLSLLGRLLSPIYSQSLWAAGRALGAGLRAGLQSSGEEGLGPLPGQATPTPVCSAPHCVGTKGDTEAASGRRSKGFFTMSAWPCDHVLYRSGRSLKQSQLTRVAEPRTLAGNIIRRMKAQLSRGQSSAGRRPAESRLPRAWPPQQVPEVPGDQAGARDLPSGHGGRVAVVGSVLWAISPGAAVTWPGSPSPVTSGRPLTSKPAATSEGDAKEGRRRDARSRG